MNVALPIGPRALEVALAVAALLSTIVLFAEPAFVADVPSVVGRLWFGITFVAPALFAAVVLARALAHAVRLVAPLVGHGRRRQSGSGSGFGSGPTDDSPVRIVVSLAFGALAAYTLWWSLGTVYVVYFAAVGGVVLGHLVAAVLASLLALLVLLRAALGRLFPDGPAAWLRRPSLE